MVIYLCNIYVTRTIRAKADRNKPEWWRPRCRGRVAGPWLGGSGSGAAAALGHLEPHRTLPGVLLRCRNQGASLMLRPASTPRRNCRRQRMGVRNGGKVWGTQGPRRQRDPGPLLPVLREEQQLILLHFQHDGCTQGRSTGGSAGAQGPGGGGAPGRRPPPQTAPNPLHPSVLATKLVCHPRFTLRPHAGSNTGNNCVYFPLFRARR